MANLQQTGGGGGGNFQSKLLILNVTDYGAVGDGSTDNATAFAAVAAAANAYTLSSGGAGFPTVYVPVGKYNYSSGLSFTQNVALRGEPGSILNYTGSAHAIDFGPSGLVAWAENTSYYDVEFLEFTGGSSMTQGLFFNAFVGFPRVRNCRFYNFGNATSTVFKIWFQTDNYNCVVGHNFVHDDDNVARNFVKVNNANANGNSLLDFHNNYIISIVAGSQNGYSGGIYCWASGSQTQIHDNDLNWGVPNIRVGNLCTGTSIQNNYMETLAAAASIELGDPSSSSGVDGVTIFKSYFNAHSAAWLVGPSPSNTGVCTNIVVDDITLVSYPALPVVKLGSTAAGSKNNRISNINTLPATIVTASNSDVWQVIPKPGVSDPVTGTAVWQVQAIGASTVDKLSFNANSGQPILSINDTNNAVTTIAATQSSNAGAAGTFTNHAYSLRTNNTARWTIDTSGNLLAATDNSWDIGASGATRPRNVYLAGVLKQYNGITTVSNGVPSELATVDLTAQTAPITATTLYTPAATGMFRISAYLKITTAGTSPVLGPLTIAFTDGTDSVAQSQVMQLATQAGATATSNSGNTTTSTLNGEMIVWAKTGVAITYAIALTGTVGSGAYEAHLKCEAL